MLGLIERVTGIQEFNGCKYSFKNFMSGGIQQEFNAGLVNKGLTLPLIVQEWAVAQPGQEIEEQNNSS